MHVLAFSIMRALAMPPPSQATQWGQNMKIRIDSFNSNDNVYEVAHGRNVCARTFTNYYE